MSNEAKNMIDPNDLGEGQLYVFKNQVLQEVETDNDDSMKRIRITGDAFSEVLNVQHAMKKTMNGYKTDINIICSALLKYAAGQGNAAEWVRSFCLDIYTRMNTDKGHDK